MIVREALDWANTELQDTSEAALAAKILLAHVLDCSTTDLFVHPQRTLTEEEDQAYRQIIARRAQHEPVAYLTGHRAFYSLDLGIDRRALIPRPETETLVDHALDAAQRWPYPRIVDVGTGSGAVAISLARHLKQAQIFATDRSPRALQLAQENARRCGVAGSITFLHGDLLGPLPVSVHLVVANLPYVSEAEHAALPPDIRLYEPREALVAGADGLDALRALLDTGQPHLTDDGVLLLEIGATQGSAVTALARQAFPRAQITILPDYAQQDRIVRIETQ